MRLIVVKDPMQNTNKRESLETGYLKLSILKTAYWHFVFVENGRIEQGTLYCRADSTGYIRVME
jgi:hypothetical protein